MHAASVGRTSQYSSSWPVDANSGLSGCATTSDQPTLTALDRPLLHARPHVIPNSAIAAGSGFRARTPPELHQLADLASMTDGAPARTADVKVNAASSDASFCSSDDQKNSSSSTNDEFAAAPLPFYHSRCPSSVVDAGAAQLFSPLPTFAGYPFPMLPPASTSGLVPPPTCCSFGLGTTSRGRIQRQNSAKSSSKLVSASRTRAHVGKPSHLSWHDTLI